MRAPVSGETGLPCVTRVTLGGRNVFGDPGLGGPPFPYGKEALPINVLHQIFAEFPSKIQAGGEASQAGLTSAGNRPG